MKQWLVMTIIIVGLCLSGRAEAAALTRVKVLKSNCNLRAKALVTSEVVGQVSENDILMAKTMDNEWVEVVAPTNINFWVLGDYVKDGIINCSKKVNVRAGAGINFNIVGQLSQGEKVDVRGTHAEWVKIAPPPACSLWISRLLVSEVPLTYVEPAKIEPAQVEPVKEEPIKPVPPSVPAIVVVPSSKPEPEIKQPAPSPQPAVEPIVPMPAKDAVFFMPSGLDLVADKGQGKWRDVEGILRPKDFIFRAPSDFRLVNGDSGKRNSATICFVKGNHAQLEALIYRHLIISGREYWVKRQKYPVIIPERIMMK
ncbi:MAG: SH3 domain-containing protein [Kiritimatiellae bacterium]|nr:SH3 domain-containing protein [Kiritimatiellia bacterium]